MSTEVELKMDAASEAGIKTVLSVVKDLDLDLQAPPSTPTIPEANSKVEDGKDQDEDEREKGENEVPTTYNAFPRFRVTWDVNAPVKSVQSPYKPQEMTPEATLVEFISTSASFFNVKRQDMKKLEWDILKVFLNNIMPANAAAWYMAKRRYYLDKPWLLQLLPFTLTHNPKKFAVNPTKNLVEFKEIYSKKVAQRKMQYLVHQGLFAYFSHKADEYGVYFFDPLYYETTEPFHANLRLVTNSSSNPNKLIHTYFKSFKEQFHYKQHSHCLVSISKIKAEIVTNTVGIVSSMIDNSYGIVQFKHGNESAKAIFCARTLYKDGFIYDKDPKNLPAIKFDGYKIPGDPKLEGKDYTWYAVLVWVGKKPSPKYNATKELLASSQYFQNQPVTYNQLAGLVEETRGPAAVLSHMDGQKLDDCMRVGEVIAIQRNGAVVSMHKNSGEKAFIPGWSFKLVDQPGVYLTTTQSVTLALADIIAFYIDPKLKAAPYYGVGCNVMVLKHAKSNSQSDDEAAKPVEGQKRRNRKSKKTEGDGSGSKARSSRRRRSTRLSSMVSDSSVQVGGRRKSTRSEKSKARFLEFLLSSDVADADAYDSDEDPTFIPPPIFEPDYDYDEYSDGEIEASEEAALYEDLKKDVEPVPLAESDDKAPKKKPGYLVFLFDKDCGQTDDDDEADPDYSLPPGVAARIADLASDKEGDEHNEGAQVEADEANAGDGPKTADEDDDDFISADEVEALLKEAVAAIPAVLQPPKAVEPSNVVNSTGEQVAVV